MQNDNAVATPEATQEEAVQPVVNGMQKLDRARALKIHKKAETAINNPDRVKWKEDCASNRRFFYNEQWQEKDDRMSKETEGRYLITLNRTKKYIETQVGMLTAETPTIKVKPFGTEDNIISDISNAVLSHVFNGSVGNVVLNRILKFGLVDNLAYAYVKRNKLNRIEIQCLYYDEVVPDSYSSDPYFRDAESFYMIQYINKNKAAALYAIDPTELQFEEPLEYSTEVNSEGDRKMLERIWDKTRNNIKITHIFTKEYKTIYREEMQGDAIVRVPTGNYKEGIKHQTLVGFDNLFELSMPEQITEHNIVPFYGEDTPNVLKLGKMFDIKEIQMLLNASFGIMMFHAQQSSVGTEFFWEDQIPNNDTNTFKANRNKIGSINILRGDGKDSAPPIRWMPTPLPAAWMDMTRFMMSEMQFNMVPDQLMGMDNAQQNRQTEVYRNYELMLNSMRGLFTIYEGFFSVLGKVILQYFFAYTDKATIYRVTGADEKMDNLQKAAEEGIDVTNEQSLIQYVTQAVTPTQDGGGGQNEYDLRVKISGLKGDYSYLKALELMMQNTDWTHYDIAIEKGSYLPSHSMMRFFLKYELFKDGVVDNQTVLEELPMANREAVIDRVSTINLVTRENSELKGAVGKLQKELDMMKEALAKGEIDMIAQGEKSKYEKQRNDFVQKERADRKVTNVSANYATKSKLHNMQVEQDRTLLALEYETAKAKLAQIEAKSDGTGNDNDEYDVEEMIRQALKQKENERE